MQYQIITCTTRTVPRARGRIPEPRGKLELPPILKKLFEAAEKLQAAVWILRTVEPKL